MLLFRCHCCHALRDRILCHVMLILRRHRFPFLSCPVPVFLFPVHVCRLFSREYFLLLPFLFFSSGREERREEFSLHACLPFPSLLCPQMCSSQTFKSSLLLTSHPTSSMHACLKRQGPVIDRGREGYFSSSIQELEPGFQVSFQIDYQLTFLLDREMFFFLFSFPA